MNARRKQIIAQLAPEVAEIFGELLTAIMDANRGQLNALLDEIASHTQLTEDAREYLAQQARIALADDRYLRS